MLLIAYTSIYIIYRSKISTLLCDLYICYAAHIQFIRPDFVQIFKTAKKKTFQRQKKKPYSHKCISCLPKTSNCIFLSFPILEKEHIKRAKLSGNQFTMLFSTKPKSIECNGNGNKNKIHSQRNNKINVNRALF